MIELYVTIICKYRKVLNSVTYKNTCFENSNKTIIYSSEQCSIDNGTLFMMKKNTIWSTLWCLKIWCCYQNRFVIYPPLKYRDNPVYVHPIITQYLKPIRILLHPATFEKFSLVASFNISIGSVIVCLSFCCTFIFLSIRLWPPLKYLSFFFFSMMVLKVKYT